MESRRWEQKDSEVALCESRRELESQRLQLHQVHQWADQARREKINLCGELVKKATQGLRKKLKTSEELDAKRQFESDNEGSKNGLCNKRGILIL